MSSLIVSSIHNISQKQSWHSDLVTNLQDCTGSWIKGLLFLHCHCCWAVNTEQLEVSSVPICISPFMHNSLTPRRLSRKTALPFTPLQEGQFSMGKPNRECQGAAHPLHHRCWPPALRHKGSLGHQVRAPCSKHHKNSWPLLSHSGHTTLMYCPSSQITPLITSGEVNTQQPPQDHWILDHTGPYTTSNSAVLLTALQTKLKKHIPLQGYCNAATG